MPDASRSGPRPKWVSTTAQGPNRFWGHVWPIDGPTAVPHPNRPARPAPARTSVPARLRAMHMICASSRACAPVQPVVENRSSATASPSSRSSATGRQKQLPPATHFLPQVPEPRAAAGKALTTGKHLKQLSSIPLLPLPPLLPLLLCLYLFTSLPVYLISLACTYTHALCALYTTASRHVQAVALACIGALSQTTYTLVGALIGATYMPDDQHTGRSSHRRPVHDDRQIWHTRYIGCARRASALRTRDASLTTGAQRQASVVGDRQMCVLAHWRPSGFIFRVRLV